jgi:hypothetical protein
MFNQNKELPGDIVFASHYAVTDDNITTRYYNGCVVQGVSNSYIMRDALKVKDLSFVLSFF